MSKLENLVEEIVSDFIENDVLFTALDVSNKVKESMPEARHREIRDKVRYYFDAANSFDYAKTPITVTLEDGSQVTALLYHPLSDAWDLDSKYDTQKRAQISAKPKIPSIIINDNGVTANIDGGLTLSAPINARDAWQQMSLKSKSIFKNDY